MDRVLHLPRVIYQWPLPRRISPFYPEVADESADWLREFHVFTLEAQETFDRCNFAAIPLASTDLTSLEEYRAACDLYNFLFAFDDLTDKMDAFATRQIADIIMDVLKNPDKDRPKHEHVIGEITKQFWTRAISISTSVSQVRFIAEMEKYTGAVVEQAKDRDEGRLRTLDEFWPVRTLTAGNYPSFEMADLIVGLPEEIIEHPLICSLRSVIADMILLNNDLVSYNKEQAVGDVHNFVAMVMNENKVDLEGALGRLAEEHKERVDRAVELWPRALSLPCATAKVAKDLAFYVDHLMGWPRGFDCWSFESGRYFA
ncbi:terpenoid synthase [Earliella scabrosa]|nr:terpenoid synthase [Earliella scabrosa]